MDKNWEKQITFHFDAHKKLRLVKHKGWVAIAVSVLAAAWNPLSIYNDLLLCLF